VDLEGFRGELRQRKIRPAYLFVGDQDLLKVDALEELRRAAGGERATVRSFFGSAKAREILEAQQNLSLLDPVAAIVIRQASKLAKAEVEELAENLDSVGGGPTIVFWDEKLDKRIKLFERIARTGAEIEFGAPRDSDLRGWIGGEARRLDIPSNRERSPSSSSWWAQTFWACARRSNDCRSPSDTARRSVRTPSWSTSLPRARMRSTSSKMPSPLAPPRRQ